MESREFKTITGTYKGKRITVVSTGIGCDNIDIVMNELDALANIDFNTREEKDNFRPLELVRIGTCGGLQPNTPVGTFVCSQKSIGFDGLLNFYAGRNEVCDLPFERAFLNHMGWSGNMCAPAPYVIDASGELIDRIAKDDMVRGVTIPPVDSSVRRDVSFVCRWQTRNRMTRLKHSNTKVSRLLTSRWRVRLWQDLAG